MTYTIGIEGIHHCRPNMCYECVPNIDGLLEEVLNGVVIFHSLEHKYIEKALDYIVNRFGHCLVTVETEYYDGCFCKCELLCAIQL